MDVADSGRIAGWFGAGVARGATHMLVVCDTFDNSDYPVFVSPTEDVKAVVEEYHGKNMQRVMEVYRLDKTADGQLGEKRVFNTTSPERGR